LHAGLCGDGSWRVLDPARPSQDRAPDPGEKSRSDWPDHAQVRDYALCVARLAAAYAAAGELEQARTATEEVMALAQGLGSRRVVGQIDLLCRRLDRWRQDPAVADLRGRLKVLVDSFKAEREAGR